VHSTIQTEDFADVLDAEDSAIELTRNAKKIDVVAIIRAHVVPLGGENSDLLAKGS
jgi:hypothetical protein